MAALHVTRANSNFVDIYEGDQLRFEVDGDGDLFIIDGQAGAGGKGDRIAAYARGQWVAVVPDTAKRGARQ